MTETSRSIIAENKTNIFWQTDVPSEALQCSYLLDAMLALSTIHRSHLRGLDGLQHTDIDKSLVLHRNSVSAFSISVTDITAQNSTAAMAMACLSLVYSCGLAQLIPSMTKADHIDQAVAVVVSTYKALHLFQGHKPWMAASGVDIPDHEAEKRRRNATALATKAAKLRYLNFHSHDDFNEKSIYDAAISAFLDIKAHWTKKVSPTFMNLLQQKKPIAVLILTAFVLDDETIKEETIPWYMSIWKYQLRNYMCDYVGPLWTTYSMLGDMIGTQVEF